MKNLNLSPRETGSLMIPCSSPSNGSQDAGAVRKVSSPRESLPDRRNGIGVAEWGRGGDGCAGHHHTL